MARDPAVSRSSGGKSSRRWETFSPMPMTRASPSPPDSSSVRMPQSFRPSRTRSLGHLTPTSAPQTSRMAPAQAAAVRAVTGGSRSGGQVGRSRTDIHSPSPAGD